MDWTYLIPVGLGIGITGIPIINAIKNQGNILLPRLVLDLGEPQKYYRKTPAGSTVIELLEIYPNSHLRVVTRNFRKDKWDESTPFFNFINEQLDKGVNVTAYTGKIDKKSEKSIDKLVEKNMKIIILNEEPIQHCLNVDNPRQLWFERIHKGYYAYDCIYTKNPHDNVWNNIENYFKELNKIGTLYTCKEKKG